MTSTSLSGPDVLVIGAGLAGLQCARELSAAGRAVEVWEAADQVGGRIRTERIDGFRCDVGFQVLNPAYPALRWVDIDALGLQPFGAGLAVRSNTGVVELTHPVRAPGGIAATLRSGLLGPLDLARLTRWASVAATPHRLKGRARRHDLSLADGLDRAGVRGPIRRVIERFLAGVLLDGTGSASNAFALLLVRMFALGVPGLPVRGMQALPQQLAGAIPDRIRLGRRAVAVVRDAGAFLVRHETGDVRVPTVVVATDPPTSARLLGQPTPRMRGVVTDWYAAAESPSASRMLHVDGRGGAVGPVVNTAVISNAAPSYAPSGQHLIQASALLTDRTVPSEAEVRRHAGEIYRADPGGWRLITRHVIPDAVPAQSVPLRARRAVRRRDGLFWCGDHRDTASIQGALVSGHRTAAAILAAGRPG